MHDWKQQNVKLQEIHKELKNGNAVIMFGC